MRAFVLAAAALSIVCGPAMASAQTKAPPRRVVTPVRKKVPTRLRVSVNGGIEAINSTTSQSFSVQANLEPAPVTASAAFKNAPLIDAGVSIRVAGRFGVGVAASAISSERSTEVTARIPHPFFFSQPRTITGSAKVTRLEVATHIDAIYIVPASRTIEIVLSGGPTIFNVSQNLVTNVTYADTYPYDTATFVSASTTRQTKTANGYNAGADVTWKLSRTAGVGALIRYTRAKTTLTAETGNAVTMNVGGLQIAGGLRFVF